MRVISLTIWGGRVYEPLLQFVKQQASKVDVYCFQEVFSSDKKFVEPTTRACHHILQELTKALPDHAPYFFPAMVGPGMDANFYPDMKFGLAIFIKNTVALQAFGDIFVYRDRNSYNSGENFANIPRNMAYAELELGGQQVTVYNFHGLWTGGGKGDTESRLEQSRKIKRFISSRKGLTVLCGDFNLLPDTESLSIIEDGLVNLISTHGITSTRTSLYGKEPKFADYALVSPAVRVNEFKVLPDEVSDHSPLYLDFDA